MRRRDVLVLSCVLAVVLVTVSVAGALEVERLVALQAVPGGAGRVAQEVPVTAEALRAVAAGLRDERPDVSFALLRRAAEQFPDDARVHNDLGVFAHDAGDFALARAEFERAVMLDGRYEQGLSNLATLHFHEGRYAQAALVLERLSGLNPAEPQYVYDRAMNLAAIARAKQVPSAAEIGVVVGLLEQVVVLDPVYAHAEHNLEVMRGLHAVLVSQDARSLN
ncbi:MAG: hypothetical protein HC945_03135 [Nitrosarchaeum sp.]|nr:hypothetical protein [Nitrosarchaeum sp.]